MERMTALTPSLSGIRQHFLDPARNEARSPTRAPDHDSFRPHIDDLAS